MSNDPSKELSNKQRLLNTFERLIPLVDGISDSVRFATLLGAVLALWIFGWMFFIKEFELKTALITSTILILPSLILSRFWWALEEVKELPEIVGEMMEDAKEEVQETVQNIRSNTSKKVGMLRSIKSLFSIRSVLNESDDLLGSYISISALINPLWLILGVLALLSVMGLALISTILVFLAF